MPFTHEARVGSTEIPKIGISITAVLIEDTIQEHVEHLTKHFSDEATVTLTAYHKHTENGLIFDLEVGGRNYRYMFKVTPEILNILETEYPAIVIYNNTDQNPLFVADISNCRSAIEELTALILETEASKLLQDK